MKEPANSRLKSKLKTMSVTELVELFRDFAIEQDKAMLYGEQRRVNALVWKLENVAEELKSREGDQRTALMRLYEHANAQVRVNAIKNTLAVAPEEARRALEMLAASKEYPAAGETGTSVWALDEGIFKPKSPHLFRAT
jgi:hypothetical protein